MNKRTNTKELSGCLIETSVTGNQEQREDQDREREEYKGEEEEPGFEDIKEIITARSMKRFCRSIRRGLMIWVSISITQV